MDIIQSWKTKARQLKIEVYTLYLAYRDPRLPWYAKAFIALVVGYALSPIDLIPDFIPVLGYLDDLVLIPLGVFLALKMIPPEMIEEKRAAARESLENGKPMGRAVAVVIVLLWAAVIVWVGSLVYQRFILPHP